MGKNRKAISLKINGIPWNQYQMIRLGWTLGSGLVAQESDRSLVQRLLEETGITEEQALELISLLGANWSSLLREAKAIKDKLQPPEPPP